MQKEKIIILPNNKDLKTFENDGFNNFILPLKDYSIGFDVYFNIEEINMLSNKYNIYVIINKFLHKNINNFSIIYKLFNKNIKFFIEDIGLINIIDKSRTILFENHIISNYKAINYLESIGINNIVLNNDLKIDEINDIRKNTNSKLYYFYVGRNVLMHSKRALVSNYKTHYNINDNDNILDIEEKVSKMGLYAKEEDGETTIFNSKIFSASKYYKDLSALDYLIVNTTFMSDLELKNVIKYILDDKMINVLDVDYYFLENDIKYKVGDLK